MEVKMALRLRIDQISLQVVDFACSRNYFVFTFWSGPAELRGLTGVHDDDRKGEQYEGGTYKFF